MDKKALYNITYGLYLLSARDGEQDNACIINTACQVANNPDRISVCAIQKNLTHDMIKKTGVFTISSLSEDAPFSLFQNFGMKSGRNEDKFSSFTDTARAENGLLRLTKYANAYISAKVVASVDLGSHTLFIGEITEGEVLSQAQSCTYGYYQKAIKPRPAASGRKGWVCSVCGYVYEGEEMPDDFICPLCKHGKDDFKKIDGGKKDEKKEIKKWKCTVCGEIAEGENPPEKCPLCGQGADKFVPATAEEVKVWAAEHILGIAKDAPEQIKEGLRANFTGECTEVGMYLAMARAAYREGNSEAGDEWKKAAYDEAEHAAKFAELLGEVLTDSTRENLKMRISAENGAAEGKKELALKAGEYNLDAIADTVMEMARDEARHGKALKGMYDRHFKD